VTGVECDAYVKRAVRASTWMNVTERPEIVAHEHNMQRFTFRERIARERRAAAERILYDVEFITAD
jgi:hypothetical protein